MTTHAEAREFARQALIRRFGREPFRGEIAVLAGVACLETSYGDGWRGSGKGSNNMGAIQCGSSWKGDRFSYIDTHPTADGKNVPYRIDFRKYLTPDAGWDDLVKVVYENRGRSCVRNAACVGDYYLASKFLHDTGYYEGFGKTVQERIQNHHRALMRSIAAADGAQKPTVVVSTLPETVRFGSTGEVVKTLQSELRIAADGIFGKATLKALKAYQEQHGLLNDGVCGPRTWTKLFGDDYQPEQS